MVDGSSKRDLKENSAFDSKNNPPAPSLNPIYQTSLSPRSTSSSNTASPALFTLESSESDPVKPERSEFSPESP